MSNLMNRYPRLMSAAIAVLFVLVCLACVANAMYRPPERGIKIEIEGGPITPTGRP